jgi:hypothetical protein
MRTRDHYLGWRNFARPAHMGLDEADAIGIEKSKQIRRQMRADMERLQAVQDKQRALGIRCREVNP